MISGLPTPRPERLTLYFGGPGFGESTVLHTPSGHWIVIDVWEQDGRNFPCEVLRQYGASQTDLLILSHADSDHICGVPTLQAQFPVRQIWHYPQHTFINFIADACDLFERKNFPPDPRLSALRDANNIITALSESSHSSAATFSTSPICFGDLTITPIAPVSADLQAASLQAKKILKFNESDLEIVVVDKLADYLERWRGADNPDNHDPNHISSAVTVSWGATRILLGGDVHYNPRKPNIGWHAVLDYLRHCEDSGRDKTRTTQLLKDLTVVKVPHHASRTSFWTELWQLHTLRPDGSHLPVPWALIAPFRHGNAAPMPPHQEILQQLHPHAARTCCTAAPDYEDQGWERFTNAGWLDDPITFSGEGCWICLDLDDDGRVELRGVGGGARLFQSPPLAL